VGPPNRTKVKMIGGGRGSIMGEAVDWWRFFPGSRWAKRCPSARVRPTHYTSIDAVSAKDVPLRYTSSRERVIPKTPHFRDVKGDFQLIRLGAYIGLLVYSLPIADMFLITNLIISGRPLWLITSQDRQSFTYCNNNIMLQ
jgi:hypothetical protein